MITQEEKLYRYMSIASLATCRKAWVARVMTEKSRLSAVKSALINDGFEPVDTELPMTDDGREVMHIPGVGAWALRPDIHEMRRLEAIAAAEERRRASMAEDKMMTSNVCHSLIDNQLCGGHIVSKPICPRCALGRSGVVETRTCDVCGHVTAVMRGDR